MGTGTSPRQYISLLKLEGPGDCYIIRLFRMPETPPANLGLLTCLSSCSWALNTLRAIWIY